MLYLAQSDSFNVHQNLALEEYLLDHTAPEDAVLFLWQANDAVVVGKNQNPWLECDLSYMETQGITLARRVSGGGTVFHDEGNLNYCFVLPRLTYGEPCIYTLIIDALARLDIDAACSGKAGLIVDGKKISGSAYCYRKDRVLHHGTLLVSANLKKLHRSLQPRERGIESHSIRSRPAEVVNLGCDMIELKSAIIAQTSETFQGEPQPFKWEPAAIPFTHFSEDAWVYDRTPRFTWQSSAGPLKIHKGLVTEAKNPDLIGRDFRTLITEYVTP